MGVNLTEAEIRRALKWANGCDGESFIDDDDWPLIEKLAAAVDELPEAWAPNHGRERNAESRVLSAAIERFHDQHGRWPGIADQTAIRDRLGL